MSGSEERPDSSHVSNEGAADSGWHGGCAPRREWQRGGAEGGGGSGTSDGAGLCVITA